MNDPLKTTPVLEINFEAYFSKENVVVILTSFQAYGCTFYQLSDKEKDPAAKTEITLDAAAEYLSNTLNKDPNILGILCKYNKQFFALSLYNSSPFFSYLSLRISDMESKNDIRPWVLFLMNVTHGAPISFISTITDGSSCEWEYGQIAAENRNLHKN